MNLALNRTTVVLLTNKSGGDLEFGDVVIVDADANAFTTTTESGFSDGIVGVIVEKNGIADDNVGRVATCGYVKQINLSASASFADLVKAHTVAGQGVPHAAPRIEGDFAQVLENSSEPAAILFGSPTPAPFTISPGLVWLGKQVASASATLDFTSLITTDYDVYEFVIIDLVPDTNNVHLYCRFSTDNGANWISSNDYGHASLRFRAAASGVGGNESGQAQIDLSGDNITNGAGESFNGKFRLFNPLGTALHKIIEGQGSYMSATFSIGVIAKGRYIQTGNVDAVRFLMSSGNITSGEIHMFGVAKS